MIMKEIEHYVRLPYEMQAVARRALLEQNLEIKEQGYEPMYRYALRIFPFNKVRPGQFHTAVGDYVGFMFKFIEQLDVPENVDTIRIELSDPFPCVPKKLFNQALAHWPTIPWVAERVDTALHCEAMYCFIVLRTPDLADMAQPLWLPFQEKDVVDKDIQGTASISTYTSKPIKLK